ncbi:MAG: SRPBCC family protein [Bacteroidetes bacterium]|nr:SRPBCC family protein [Bacteroidota bacterium]
MSSTPITIEAHIDADTQKVWDYWTKPEHITKWNFASDDWHCPSAQNDLRVGGTYSARMEAKDGSFGFDFGAVYDEVKPLQSLIYTMGDGRKAATRFEKTNTGTKVSTTFDAEQVNPVDMQKAGWQAILNNFKKYIENN